MQMIPLRSACPSAHPSSVNLLRGALRLPLRLSRMTTSPPRFHLWTPSRGISFSPGAELGPSPTVIPPRPLSYSTTASGGYSDEPQSMNRRQRQEKNLKELGNAADADLPLIQPDSVGVAQHASNTGTEPVDDAAASAPDEAQVKTESSVSAEPPVAALEYAMPDDLFRAAKAAAPGSPESFWSYSLYRGPGGDGPLSKPKVHYCKSKHTAERVCQLYFANEKVLGFDLEWAADASKSAGPRRNVSLIQLSSQSRIALFHVALFAKGDDLVAPTFKKIMEDPEINKVGVWIKGDATRLRTHLNIDSKGLVELSHLYRLVTYSRSGEFKNINKKLIPLATQVEQCLHLPMFKGQDVRSSDWTRPLGWNQIVYSASDAYAGVHLYATLEHHRKQLVPCPPTPHHAELNLPIRLSDGLDLETDSEEESSEIPPEESEERTKTLTPEARKRALKAHLNSCKAVTNRAVHETEKVSDIASARDPRVVAADNWAATFMKENYPSIPLVEVQTSVSNGYISKFVELRAYHLWHTNKEMSTAGVGALLHTPPLKSNTVAGYIFNVVTREGLPVNEIRFAKDITKKSAGFMKFADKFLSALSP